MIRTTILIATHNGAAVIGRTLEGYCQLENVDAPWWKIVVIDNASTDETAEILESFKSRLPLTLLYEATPGKNAALNTGLEEIEGDLIILSDDDSIPQPGFLTDWLESSQKLSDFDVLGGSIHLTFDKAPPKWLLAEKLKFEELYAIREGVPEGDIHHLKIYGPNMAVRRRVFDAGVRFDPTIGPNGTDVNYSMGSENAFCISAVQAGFRTGFASKPLVHHIVRPHQMTPAYWANRAYKLGRGVAQRNWDSGVYSVKRQSTLKAQLSKHWRFGRGLWLYVLTKLPGDRRTFLQNWEYNFFRGFQDEHAKQKVRRMRSDNVQKAHQRVTQS